MNNNNYTWSIGKISLAVAAVAVMITSYSLYSSSHQTYSLTAAAADAIIATSTPSENTDIIGKELLALLDKIESIKLDTSIFSDKAFTSLQDYTVTLVPQNPGRSNPFAPLPGVAPTKTTTTSAR